MNKKQKQLIDAYIRKREIRLRKYDDYEIYELLYLLKHSDEFKTKLSKINGRETIFKILLNNTDVNHLLFDYLNDKKYSMGAEQTYLVAKTNDIIFRKLDLTPLFDKQIIDLINSYPRLAHLLPIEYLDYNSTKFDVRKIIKKYPYLKELFIERNYKK